jgi:ABC-type transport system substrate-binding protein
MAKYPDKFVAFAAIDPRRADTMELLVHAIETLGLCGVKFGPIDSGLSLLDPRMTPMLAHCAANNLPLTLHMGTTFARNAQIVIMPDSHALLARFDDYPPKDTLDELSGFGGRKQACVDTVRFRILTEAGARIAALETGEIHISGDVPAVSMERLMAADGVEVVRLENCGLNIGYPDVSAPPTDNLLVRQAMVAAMDMEEMMDAATDGNFQLSGALQFPGQAHFSEAGTEFYNQIDSNRARAPVAEAGYEGEPIVLLTNQRFPSCTTPRW